jgi:four helix bundle protein
MQDFRKLKVWRTSHDLTRAIYEATKAFPSTEKYALTDQLRRAAVSIPANIAEGSGRGSRQDFARFMHMAMGSASEVEYLLLLSRGLTYLNPDSHSVLEQKTTEVKRMLTAFLRALTARIKTWI